MKKTKVIFVAGSGRCGSTLINSILGQFSGAFSCGEVRYIWDRGFEDNSYCGCGERFLECPMWQGIIDEAFKDNELNAKKMVELRERVHTRQLFGVVLPFWRKRLVQALQPYLPALAELYDGIASVTGAEVIIDTSKFPTHGFALSLLPNVELYVLHLVRDGRAVAYSWQRRKQYGLDHNGDPIFMAQHHPAKSSYWWATWNAIIELLWRRENYFRLRYEDFVLEPQSYTQQILDWVGLDVSAETVVKNNQVNLAPNHAVSGNPSRYAKGALVLRPDSEWRQAFSGIPFYATTGLLGLQLRHYGYSLFD